MLSAHKDGPSPTMAACSKENGGETRGSRFKTGTAFRVQNPTTLWIILPPHFTPTPPLPPCLRELRVFSVWQGEMWEWRRVVPHPRSWETGIPSWLEVHLCISPKSLSLWTVVSRWKFPEVSSTSLLLQWEKKKKIFAITLMPNKLGPSCKEREPERI